MTTDLTDETVSGHFDQEPVVENHASVDRGLPSEYLAFAAASQRFPFYLQIGFSFSLEGCLVTFSCASSLHD